jgi:hypothetical protein
MKIYRNDYRAPGYTSRGFSFHTSAKAAWEACDNAKKRTKGDHDEIDTVETEPIEVSLTKCGLLRLLNTYATHPDNG